MWRLLPALFAATTMFAQHLPLELLEQKTTAQIEDVGRSLDGVLGFYAIDLTSGRNFGLHADTVFPTASSIKVTILLEVLRQAQAGKFKLTDEITIQQSESVGGSGYLQILLRRGPVKLSVMDVASAMIETSDNTATNKLIDLVGMDNVNRLIQTLGLSSTKLQRKMIDTAAAKAGRENISTPSDLAHLMMLLYQGKAVDPGISKEAIRLMKLVDADIAEAVPAGIEVAAKPGDLTGVRCETGIVFDPKRPFAVAIMSTYLTAGENPVGKVAHILYEHFERIGHSNQYGNRVY